MNDVRNMKRIIFLLISTFLFSEFCLCQKLDVVMSYNKSDTILNLVITNISNDTVFIRDMSNYAETAGSGISLNYKNNNGTSIFRRISLSAADNVSADRWGWNKYTILYEPQQRETLYYSSVIKKYMDNCDLVSAELKILYFYENESRKLVPVTYKSVLQIE